MKGSSPETRLAGSRKIHNGFFFYGTTGVLSSDEEYDGSILSDKSNRHWAHRTVHRRQHVKSPKTQGAAHWNPFPEIVITRDIIIVGTGKFTVRKPNRPLSPPKRFAIEDSFKKINAAIRPFGVFISQPGIELAW